MSTHYTDHLSVCMPPRPRGRFAVRGDVAVRCVACGKWVRFREVGFEDDGVTVSNGTKCRSCYRLRKDDPRQGRLPGL